MTVQQILDLLSNHGFTKIADTLKLSFLNDAYYDVTTRDLWPFMEATADIATVNGQASLSTLPADFSKVLSLVDTFSDKPIRWERLDRLSQRYAADGLTTTGNPSFYYFIGSAVNLYPVPNSVRTLQLRYLKKPTALLATDSEATILLPPRHHRIIVAGALRQLYQLENKHDVAATFEKEFEQRILTMRDDLMTRQTSDTDYIEVIDPDDYDYS